MRQPMEVSKVQQVQWTPRLRLAPTRFGIDTGKKVLKQSECDISTSATHVQPSTTACAVRRRRVLRHRPEAQGAGVCSGASRSTSYVPAVKCPQAASFRTLTGLSQCCQHSLQ